MPWWSWMIIGGMLLGAELFLIDAQFFLVFMGVAALGVGLLAMIGMGGPEWLQWLVFGALAIVLMVSFRRRLYEKLRGNLPGFSADPTGAELNLAEGLAAGAEGRVEFRGSTWQARNVGQEAIAPGGKARIERTDGLTLHVRRAS